MLPGSSYRQSVGIRRSGPEQSKTGTVLRTRTAVAFGTIALLSFLFSACASKAPAAISSRSGHHRAELAYARCMRSHGVTDFPDPDAQGDFPPFHPGVPLHTSNLAADACWHFLTRSSASSSQRTKKAEFPLKVARCMHSHGFPSYPEPTLSNDGGIEISFTGTGIDAKSQRFQLTQRTCERETEGILGVRPHAPNGSP